mmetsp:Transcript_87845/g.250283  ORF Transcript_87845/g.250283 Transcript_87845/m.250283 type:complete len:278 (-) Transcript_87845:401-1234(-)
MGWWAADCAPWAVDRGPSAVGCGLWARGAQCVRCAVQIARPLTTRHEPTATYCGRRGPGCSRPSLRPSQALHLIHPPLCSPLHCPTLPYQARFYMVMELCVGGEMFDRIVKKSMYTEDEARKCVAQMADALEYCHGQGIVHRDIKPENLLYARPDPDETVKIADFGLAHLLKKDEHLKTACGTPGYVAPEVLTGEGYGTEVDMWSIGVVVYILLCGYPPFYDDSTAILFNMIKKGEYDFNPQYWDAVSDSAKDFISQLLCVDPTARLSASGVKEVRA